MSASAAVRSTVRIPLDATLCQPAAVEDAAPRKDSNFQVEGITRILRRSGHTVRQLSNRTQKLYGNRSPYFIPPTFLYKLRSEVTPHVCQIVALSESTGYRFVDWMRIFGFDLYQIPRLQMQLHPERTVLVTPIEFETGFVRPQSFSSHASTIPETVCTSSISMHSRLSMHSRSMHLRPGGDFWSAGGRYCFAKIGSRDAWISPKLLPGSIVRVDRRYRQPWNGADGSALQNLLWLIEKPGGLTCCHLRWINDHEVVLLPSRPPLGTLPLSVPIEARVLGLVEWERGFVKPDTGESGVGRTEFQQPLSPSFDTAATRFPGLLRAARRRTGLTFRAAQQLTGAIARSLASRDYAIGLGLLSDYEAMDRLPRHVAKIISLCIAYCLDIRQLLEGAGVYVDDTAKSPLPGLDRLASSGPEFRDDAEPCKTIGLGAGYFRSSGGRIERTSGI
jgi:hypothetical protein